MSLGEDIATAIASGAKRQLRKLGLNRQNIDEIVYFRSNSSSAKETD